MDGTNKFRLTYTFISNPENMEYLIYGKRFGSKSKEKKLKNQDKINGSEKSPNIFTPIDKN